MKSLFRFNSGLLLLSLSLAQFGWAQARKAKTTEPVPDFGPTGSTVSYHGEWIVIQHTQATFDKIGLVDVVLLRSEVVTGSTGLGEPMHDVRVVAASHGRVLANYGTPTPQGPEATRLPALYVDAYLDITDVTGDGIPEILFHSGSVGVSDSVTNEHILRYSAASNSFTDISVDQFYRSGTHGLRWAEMAGRAILVLADRNWSPTTPLEERCHYCGSPFDYTIYEWNAGSNSWLKERKVSGTKSYGEANEALDGDWKLIMSQIRTPK
jgi:hypothetical protein